MPLIIIGIAVAYTGIGLAMRKKFFPREPVQMALVWPVAVAIGKK